MAVFCGTYATDFISCFIEPNRRLCSLSPGTVISISDTKYSNPRNEEIAILTGSWNRNIIFLPVDIVDVFPKVEEIYFNETNIPVIKKESLHGLTSLKILNLENCRVDSIEVTAFEDLVNLEVLDLSQNRLMRLRAKTFSWLPNLIHLHLDQNIMISVSSKMFVNNQKIQELLLDHNDFGTFPKEAFSPMSQSLKVVTLNSNRISTVDSDWFKDFVKLEEIHLKNNQITAIPDDFLAESESLTNFAISGNQITSVDFAIFANQKKLKTIHFDENKITHFKNVDIADTFSKIEYIDLGENACITDLYRDMQVMKRKIRETCTVE